MYGVGAGFSYDAGDPVAPLGPGVQDMKDWWFRFVPSHPLFTHRCAEFDRESQRTSSSSFETAEWIGDGAARWRDG